MSGIDGRTLLVAAGMAAAAPAVARHPAAASLVPTQPMGWNNFTTTITEQQALETTAIMAARLKPFAYDISTVDIRWYEPEAQSYDYSAAPRAAMDFADKRAFTPVCTSPGAPYL